MENMDLFGKTFDCVCGRSHSIVPREVVYGDDAMAQLPAVCARATEGRSVVMLMDVRTRAAAGGEAARILSDAGWQVTELLVPDPGPGRSPICDDHTMDALAPDIGRPDLILPVGSGVVSDLGKWAAMDRSLPYLTVATAASMNGYASSNIAPTVRGVKRLVYGRAPVAVLASPAVLADAPREMTASGLGDVLAKSVSSTDWRLNHVLFEDYYCPRSVGLIEQIEPMYMDRPEELRAGEGGAMEALFSALLLTGVAMTMAETSAPSSGAEHLIGHSLDMMSSVDGAEHDLHGRQVGVGTILASELYRRVLATESPQFAAPVEQVDRAFWDQLADVVEEEYTQKVPRLHQAAETLSSCGVWDELRAELAPMVRSPEQVRDCLARAGAAYRAEDIKCTPERLLAALLHAHEMRPRFTVLDLARLMGILPTAAEEIVDAWT
ncbi:hypothetical protein LCGC14_1385510 [marine sediment metagenome]|uniref:Alcohol dehydrogenase iron-type/glycerol dehydrogenase GldA domain-containing protein n=1 Tax=marine sediment metagenome TaxID=412755 RepID=A0A0F9MGX5_9ZZZZ